MPNKVIILLFFVFVLSWDGAVNAVFFTAAVFSAGTIFFILYLSICLNLAGEK